MALIFNRGKETLHVGGHVLGHGQHDVPDFDELVKKFPSLSSLVELVEPDAPKQPYPSLSSLVELVEPDAPKQPPKEPDEQPKQAPKKVEK